MAQRKQHSLEPEAGGHSVTVLCLQEFEKQVNVEMQKVTEYFGEKYDATDPGKVLRVIRDFMLLFDKAIFEIKVLLTWHLPSCGID